MFKKIAIFIMLVFSACFLVASTPSLAEDDPVKKLEELNNKIKEYENTITDLKGQQKTLASTISYLDSQIQLTATQIIVTEQKLTMLAVEIAELSVKINILDNTITDVSAILSSRIEATYKRESIEPIYLLFSSSGFGEFFSRLKYLKTAQENDRRLLFEMQKSKMNFDNQKELKQEKQAQERALKKQLEAQKITLAQQKVAKQELLEVTKNDELKFQQLLAAARAEIEAIQSILAGQGDETKVGDVKDGDNIASIITGSSACSTGTHLHFEVAQDQAHSNPASYLKSIGVDWDLCGWYGCDGPFSFSGSWNWPMNEPIIVTQGYGMTAYARSGAYGGNSHTGIDVVSKSSNGVKAVKDGVLYRGSIACGGGTLRYVKVDHKDSDLDTYYVHINYVK
ncbi:murein hydrolase activator EnvC family protein [Patescibacteria group bacterium]